MKFVRRTPQQTIEPHSKISLVTTLWNAPKSVFTTEKACWRPFSYPPEHYPPFIRTYIRSSCYVEEFYVEASYVEELRAKTLSLSLSLSLSCPSFAALTYTFFVHVLTYTFPRALTYTFFVYVFRFLSPRFPYVYVFRSPYVYVLTYTYLRIRSYVEVRLEKKFLQNFFPSGLPRNFFGKFFDFPLRRIYYVEYIT